MILEEIEQIVKQPLSRFRSTYQLALASEVEIIGHIGDQLYENHGKQLRPLLLMLSAGASGAHFEGKEQLAVAIELLHNSTLLHDDVVDESDMRRGVPSIRSQYGNKTAVLCGDYFLAKVMLLLNEYNDREVNRIIDLTVMEMSTGELLQQRRSLQMDEDINHYRDTIYRKTASLMGACTELGALGTPWRNAMRDFGRHFGMAFQLRDDILDYTPSATTGKPTGNDLKEHKMTLPLIAYLHSQPDTTKATLQSFLRSGELNDSIVTGIVAAVAASDALDNCRRYIDEELQQAEQILQALPASAYRNGIQELLQLLQTSKHQSKIKTLGLQESQEAYHSLGNQRVQ